MKEFLHHLFLPKATNNYRARILHHKFLLGFIVFFFSAGILMSFVRTNFPSVLGTFSDISTQQLLLLTNEKRQETGVAPLTVNDNLSQAAANKASDMFGKNYWAHNAPDGTTPWVFIKGAGYNYIYAGENLARGFNNASEVINAWMASPEHKKNMLSSNYQNVGFAVSTGKLNGEDTVLIVEMLGSANYAPPVVAKELEKPAAVAVASGSPAAVAEIETETLGAQKRGVSTKPKEVAVNYLPQVRPLVNSQVLSQVSTRIILSIFIAILLLDMIVIERKKILRFVGHNLDHVFFFSLMLLVAIILAKGAIV
ncbi:MAG: CAP domain-containing protein [Patescibacteria group bacterium]|nr:CAP domain-containing protein [Patescibacteria group bacterium]